MTYWLGEPGYCDACHSDLTKEEFFYDAKTKSQSPPRGRWGKFCPRCFNEWCLGTGTGLGQKFRTLDLKKVEG